MNKTPRYRRSEPVRWADINRPDWVIVLLPTFLAIKAQYGAVAAQLKPVIIVAYVLANGLLLAIAYLRHAETRFETQLGPLYLYCAAGAIAISRPSGIQNLFIYLLVAAFAFRIAETVDARKIIASLIDGIGLYLLANIVAYYVLGLHSPSETIRQNLSAEHLARVTFPLSLSVNLAPLLAATFLAASYPLLRKPGWPLRIARLVGAASALVILVESGSRMPLATALLLLMIAVLFPGVPRILAPCLVIFSAISPWVLRPIIGATGAFTTGLLSAISNRTAPSGSTITDLAGRGSIWDKSLTFWSSSVNSLLEMLFGYGLQGHYKSGASHYYAGFMAGIFRENEKLIHTHNSWLQQLFDAGLVGVFLLGIVLFWTSLRLAKRSQVWGEFATAGSLFMSGVLLGAMTEVLLTPDANVQTFFLMMIIIAAACQLPAKKEVAAPVQR